MPLPTPKPSEEEAAFVQRCVPLVLESEDLDADSEDDREQAVAICYSQWREAQKEKQMYTCECVECGHTMQSDQHCAELACPKCGGQMRRAERPGPGKDTSEGRIERKTFSGFVTKFDDDQGIVEAYWAVMGNIDEGNDIIHPGAFKKTFQERGNQVMVLDNHRTDSILRAIAEPPLLLREAGREELPAELLKSAPDATGGAFGRFQMLMDTPEGKGAYIRLKKRAISKWSFGYDAVQSDYGTVEREGKEINVRNLRQIKLYEISPVLFAMNEATHTLSAKGTEMEDDKGASGATNLPIADRGRAWDATAAVRRVRSHTGSDEEPSASYKNAFFWYDSGEPKNFGSYKLPFADVVGGKLTAIPRGVFAVAQVLQGGRGGVDIGGDESAVKSRVNRYYARMRQQFDDDGIVPPWEKQAIAFGEGKFILVLQERLPEAETARITERLNAWLESDGKAFVLDIGQIDVKLIRLDEQPTINHHYTINAAKEAAIDIEEALKALAGRAGPDDAPPPEARPDDAPPTMEQRLKEARLSLARLELLEVEGNEKR